MKTSSLQLWSRYIAILLAGTILLVIGCSNGGESTQTFGDFTIELQPSPNPPVVGVNTFIITLRDAAGEPVTDATVHLHYSMPAMAGMPAMADKAQAKYVGEGQYEVEVDLGAGGKFPWNLTVEIVRERDVLAVTRWQVTPGTKGIKFVADEQGKTEIGKADYYTCTMHPSVKRQEPGKCPICAMDLVPVYRESSAPLEKIIEAPARTVAVPFYQQQLIGVQKDRVKLRPVAKTVRAIGNVTYNEAQIVAINLKFSGWIEKLYINYIGQFVQKGEPLFEIYSPELVTTQEEYLQTLANISSGEVTAKNDQSGIEDKNNPLLKSARKRLLLWGISEQQIREIETTGVPRITVTFHSSISGYVIEKNVLEGQKVGEGKELFTIADLSTVWILADIYEHELPFIKPGQIGKIQLAYDPAINYMGKVDYIYPTLDSHTRTVKVRLVVPNPKLKLRPGMYVDVEIVAKQGKQLTIPATAVLNTGIRELVFVDRGKGRFEPREIKLGMKVGRYYVVMEGLKEGEVIVKSGNFLIDAEAHVQGVLQTMGD